MAEKKKALFSLRQPEKVTIRIPLKGDDGTKYTLTHVMRPPSAADKKTYMRLVSVTEYDEEGKPVAVRDLGGASERLYDDCALAVEGYETPDGGDWKALMPLDHKIWVVERLLKMSGLLDGKLEKN